jgi:hypothetical protein
MKQLFTSLGIFLCFIVVLNSCKKTDDGEENTNTCSVPAPKAHNNSPVDLGKTVQLTAETIAGATYKWTGPGFSSTSQNPSFTFASKTQLGRYAVVAIVGNCVSDTFYTYVTSCQTEISSNLEVVTTTSTTGVSKKTVYVPKNGNVNLNASNVNGAAFAWEGPVIGTADSVSLAPRNGKSQFLAIKNVQPHFAGKYIVKATTDICASSDTIELVVNPATPIITVTYTPNKALVGNQIKISITPATHTPGAIYTWRRTNKKDRVDSTGNPVYIDSIATRELNGTYTVFAKVGNYTTPISAPVVVKSDFSGTNCGGMTSFTDTVTNKTYTVVSIGNQCWTRENVGPSVTWDNALNNVIEQQGACPKGWHVPSDAEWTTAQAYKGDDTLKVKLNVTSSAAFWSATQLDATKAWARNFVINGPVFYINRITEEKGKKILLRCIKD